MNDGAGKVERFCCDCGARNASDLIRCWLCGRTLEKSGSDFVLASEPDARRIIEQRDQRQMSSFSIGSMMLCVTLVAVILGVGRMWPGVAIGLTVLVAPAFIRTVVFVRRRKATGERLSPLEKTMAFLASFGIVTATAVAAGVAFYATCWAGFFGGMTISEAAGARGYDPLGYGLVTGVIVGGLAGLVVLALLVWRLWPLKRT